MLNTFIELKEPLDYIYRNTINNEFKSIYLNSIDWFIIKQLKTLFKIFTMPSIKLQGEVYTTLPKGLLYIYKIYNDLEEFNEKAQSRIQQDPTLVSIYYYYS
jgi:hypothetical protein